MLRDKLSEIVGIHFDEDAHRIFANVLYDEIRLIL